MRVRNIGSVAAGDTVTMRLATYVHPLSGNDLLRVVRGVFRWAEDVTVRLTGVDYLGVRLATSYPADRVLAGEVVTKGFDKAPIIGLAHPERYGWASLGGTFDETDMRTIAALKAALGKLDPGEVAALEKTRCRTGNFQIKKPNGKIASWG